MKHLFVLMFAVVAALCIVKTQGVSSKYGTKGIHDTLMHRFYAYKESSWWNFGGVSEDYTFPPPGYVNGKTISAIYVNDQSGGKNTSTGYGSLSNGGPGAKMGTIHMKGKHGYNFTIEIYAHNGM